MTPAQLQGNKETCIFYKEIRLGRQDNEEAT